MAPVNLIGFNTADLAETRTTVGSSVLSFSSGTKRSGSHSLRVNSGTGDTGAIQLGALATTGAQADANVATSYVTFWVQWATKPSSNDDNIFRIESSAGRKFEVRLTSAGVLKGYNSAGTLVGTGATALVQSQWHRIDVMVGTSATVGDYEVKVDGVSQFSGTTNTLAGNAVLVWVGRSVNNSGTAIDIYFDDVYWDDAAHPAGNYSIVAALPNADGHYQDFSLTGAASHYLAVNEVPPDGNTSFLRSSIVVPCKETEALQDAATVGVSGTVNVVKSLAVVSDNAGRAPAMRLLLRSGTTDDTTAADYVPTSTYTGISKLYTTNPATGAAWAVSAIDSIECGSQTPSSAQFRMTFTCVMVMFTPQSTVPPKINQYRRRGM